MSIQGKANKQLQNATRHDFLHTFFPIPNRYAEIQVNGYWLVNQFNSGNQRWEVAIFTEESFINRKTFLQSRSSNMTINKV